MSSVVSMMAPMVIYDIITVLIVLVWILLVSSLMTVIERKGLAALHRRKGPSYNGYFGLLQIAADGVKLMGKDGNLLGGFTGSSTSGWFTSMTHWFSSVLMFIGSYAVMLLVIMDIYNGMSISYMSLLSIGVVGTLGHMGTVLPGYTSSSNYTYLGGLRSCIMYVSYDVCLLLMLMMYQQESMSIISGTSGSLSSVITSQSYGWMSMNIVRNPLLALGMLYILVLEMGRVPGDLAEAESELVSGFNTEYGGMPYAIMASAEYSGMLLGTCMIAILMVGVSSVLSLVCVSLLVFYMLIILRGTLPRVRYTEVLSTLWQDLSGLSMLMFAGLLLI